MLGMRRFSLLAAATFLAPGAAAEPPACMDVTDAPDNPLGVYTYGDATRGIEFWLEDNGYPGLQRQACLDGDEKFIDRDVLLTATLL